MSIHIILLAVCLKVDNLLNSYNYLKKICKKYTEWYKVKAEADFLLL